MTVRGFYVLMPLRPVALIALALLLAFALASLPPWLMAADNPAAVKATIDSSRATPRQVEEATEQAVLRDYSRAWQLLAQAMSENRADVLNAAFVGIARDKFTQAVNEQKAEGLSRRYVDRGHKVDVAFYSVEGSAIQLRDTFQLEIQWLDGDKVVHSEQATLHCLALLTPTENSWKVRVLESVPGF
ncbi:MAG TPA: hypothetical protein VN622_11440 [Clostridia bacterium]|nr:hypothetical protein [Clostridia bacterium]